MTWATQSIVSTGGPKVGPISKILRCAGIIFGAFYYMEDLLRQGLQDELRELLDRISQDMFHSFERSRSSSEPVGETSCASTFYELKVEERPVDHFTSRQWQLLEPEIEALLAFPQKITQTLADLEAEIEDLLQSHDKALKRFEHCEMVAEHWLPALAASGIFISGSKKPAEEDGNDSHNFLAG
jgi:hypothetical protein